MSEKNENLRSNLANFIKKAKEDKIVSYEEINSILSDDFSVEKTEKLIKKLEKKYGKKIVLNLEIDESIIGGGIIKVGNDVINGSIKHQIEDMKRIF